MDRTRDWGTRIAHEVSLHEENSFLTLTYSDDHLPDDYSVDLRELQLFVKRLRKEIAPTRIRFYACGEYGDQGNRPHYHAIIFGYDFPDRSAWRKTATGYLTYRSALLEKLWPFGHAEIGTVSRSSGAYVARYCLKKINGPIAADHYTRVHPLTGAVSQVRPEFATMSTKPGIGHGWFERWEADCFPSNFVVIDGEKFPVPKYYKARLKNSFKYPGSRPEKEETLLAIDDFDVLSRKGKQWLRDNPEDLTKERLAVREESRILKQARIKRDG